MPSRIVNAANPTTRCLRIGRSPSVRATVPAPRLSPPWHTYSRRSLLLRCGQRPRFVLEADRAVEAVDQHRFRREAEAARALGRRLRIVFAARRLQLLLGA